MANRATYQETDFDNFEALVDDQESRIRTDIDGQDTDSGWDTFRIVFSKIANFLWGHKELLNAEAKTLLTDEKIKVGRKYKIREPFTSLAEWTGINIGADESSPFTDLVGYEFGRGLNSQILFRLTVEPSAVQYVEVYDEDGNPHFSKRVVNAATGIIEFLFNIVNTSMRFYIRNNSNPSDADITTAGYKLVYGCLTDNNFSANFGDGSWGGDTVVTGNSLDFAAGDDEFSQSNGDLNADKSYMYTVLVENCPEGFALNYSLGSNAGSISNGIHRLILPTGDQTIEFESVDCPAKLTVQAIQEFGIAPADGLTEFYTSGVKDEEGNIVFNKFGIGTAVNNRIPKPVIYDLTLDTIQSANMQDDWNQENPNMPDYIKNKPVIPEPFSGAYDDLTGKPTLFSGDYDDLTDKPALAAVATSGSYSDLSGKPSLAAVATSGDYDDLSDKPFLAAVATSGAYADLTGKPVIALANVVSFRIVFDGTNNPNVDIQFKNTFNASLGSATRGGAGDYAVNFAGVSFDYFKSQVMYNWTGGTGAPAGHLNIVISGEDVNIDFFDNTGTQVDIPSGVYANITVFEF